MRTYMHSDLVTVLKRCPKGNQANFTLLRQPQEVNTHTHTHTGWYKYIWKLVLITRTTPLSPY